jgi:hypothetical protein
LVLGSVTLFDDNSIELENGSGRKWFPSLAELENAFRASDTRALPAIMEGQHAEAS